MRINYKDIEDGGYPRLASLLAALFPKGAIQLADNAMEVDEMHERYGYAMVPFQEDYSGLSITPQELQPMKISIVKDPDYGVILLLRDDIGEESLYHSV